MANSNLGDEGTLVFVGGADDLGGPLERRALLGQKGVETDKPGRYCEFLLPIQ